MHSSRRSGMFQLSRCRTQIPRCSIIHCRTASQFQQVTFPISDSSTTSETRPSRGNEDESSRRPFGRPQFTRPGSERRAQLAESTWIRLVDLPRTALHEDVRKAVHRSGVQAPFQIYIDYHRFLPTGSAFIEFDSHEDQKQALKEIGGKRFQVSGQDITAIPSNPPSRLPKRMRGFKGRAAAAEKGLVDGDGMDGGITERAKSVVLWGLPGKLLTDDVKASLKGFHFRTRFDEGEGEARYEDAFAAAQSVVKLDPAPRSLTSRYLVRLETNAEAHRLVRRIHMTYWDRGLWGAKYMAKARVVY